MRPATLLHHTTPLVGAIHSPAALCEDSLLKRRFTQYCLVGRLLEEAYVARDPFDPGLQPLILGSHCSSCNKVVCVSATCSIFYCKRFCLDCVRSNPDEFPAQVLQVSSMHPLSSPSADASASRLLSNMLPLPLPLPSNETLPLIKCSG